MATPHAPFESLPAPKSRTVLPTQHGQNYLGGILRRIADFARFDPFVKIAAAIANRAAGNLYEFWPATTAAPILQGAHCVAEKVCRSFFVDQFI